MFFFYSCVFFTKFLDIETLVTDMSNDYQNGTTITSHATSTCQNGGSRTSRNDEGSRPARLKPLTVCFFSLKIFFFNHTNDYLSNYAQAYNPNQFRRIQQSTPRHVTTTDTGTINLNVTTPPTTVLRSTQR